MQENFELVCEYYRAKANLEAVRRERELIGKMLERASAYLDEAEFQLEAKGVSVPR